VIGKLWSVFKFVSVAVVIVALYLLIRDVFATLFSPSEPARRLVRVDDATARAMLTRFLAIGGAGCALFFTTTWLGGLGLAERPGDLMRIVSSLSVCVLLSAYVVAHRRTVAGLIRGGRPGAGLLRSALASLWHVLIVGYLVVATGFNVVAIVAGEGFRVGPVLAPLAGFFVGFLVHGLAVIVIDRRVRARRALLYAASGGSAAGLTPDGSAASVASGEGGGRPDPITVWQARWQACGERIAAVGAFVVGLLVTLAAAGLLGEGSAASKSLGLVIIAFLAYAVYQAMLTWIDGRIADEDGPAHVDSEDGMGPGASRLATLLPLLRSVLGVTVFTVAGMVALSAVGVNVGPLFAGAGIVGLAIGFGAQSLIRDIFSGVFFLADDAFRRGEYIAVGSTTGSVERISLRSFQLRHHNGPLHTIPFGNIDQLTNFSRDWAIMKLKLRLEYGADIEKVRKMIKKLGQEMAADPEIGHRFLDPPKSQGVVEMEDSAMILRVKFMTRPGDQFLARRHVYSRIHDLFEREGIAFASRQVVVRVEGGLPEGAEARARAQAAAGAALPAIEAEAT